MKRDTVNYFLAGIVVLLALLFAGWVMLQMTGRNNDVVEYHTNYDNVYGLSFGTPVFYQGYRVGQVERIEPQEKGKHMNFDVWMSVDKQWKIPVDSHAVLTSAGLLADVYIEIERGQADASLKPGEALAGSQVVDVFAAFTELAEQAVRLTNEGLRPLVKLLNERLDRITGDLAAQTPEILEDTREAVVNLKRASAQLEILMSEGNRNRVEDMLGDVSETTRHLRSFAQGLEQTRNSLDQLMRDIQGTVDENRPELQLAIMHLRASLEKLDMQADDILRNLDSASGNLDAFSRAIYKDPSRLIKSAPEDKQP